MKKSTLIFCSVLLLFSCQEKPKEPYFKPGYNYVQKTPDSLRTPEQKEFIKKLTIILIENIGAKNNEMIFKLSKEEFVAKGIPVEYYELIQKDLATNNKYIKEHHITNVDSIVKVSYKMIGDSIYIY